MMARFQKKYKLGYAYDRVYYAWDSVLNCDVALKRYRVEKKDEGIPPKAMKEMSILKSLSHPNVIRYAVLMPQQYAVLTISIRRLLDVDRNEAFNDSSFVLVMPYTRRSLRKILDDSVLSVNEVRSYVTQILSAVAYIHANGIIHGSLISNHILVGQNGQIEIIDFEFSYSSRYKRRSDRDPYMGLLWVQPPEVILDSDSYSTAVDVWSVGCIMYEMLHNRPAFPGSKGRELVQMQFELMGTPTEATWPGISRYPLYRSLPVTPPQPWITDKFSMIGKEGQDLIGKLLTLNPRHRITAKRALDHPYVSSAEEHR